MNPCGEDIVPSPEKTPSMQIETKNRGHQKTPAGARGFQKCCKTVSPHHPPSRGSNNSSPGGHVSTSPARRVWRGHLFFRREHRRLPCGRSVSRSRGGGVPESRFPAGHTKTENVLKIPNDRTICSTIATYAAVLSSKDTYLVSYSCC